MFISIHGSNLFQTYGAQVLRDAVAELSPVLESGLKDLGNELKNKHRIIADSLEKELSSLTDSYKVCTVCL